MIAPPKSPSNEELEALVKEARARQLRRRLIGAAGLALAAAAAISIWAAVPGAGKPHSKPQGTSSQVAPAQHAQSCGVRVKGTRILSRSGRVLYREPVRGTMGHETQCSGPTIWVVWDNGVAMSQQGYVGVRSGNSGHSWRLVFSEPYFGVTAPHELDSYLGPWTLVGSAAYFTGWCPACGYGTVSLWVTKNGGRTFRRYNIPALTGHPPARIRVSGNRVTLWGRRVIGGKAISLNKVTVRVR
jgi:hypothetical protein